MFCNKSCIIVICLMMAGCGMHRTDSMSDNELQSYLDHQQDQQLCQIWHTGGIVRALSSNRLLEAAERESLRRGLGDCSADHFQCVKSYGVEYGSPNYTKCRVALSAMHANQDAANQQTYMNMMQTGAQMMSPPQSGTTTCTSNSMVRSGSTIPNPIICR